MPIQRCIFDNLVSTQRKLSRYDANLLHHSCIIAPTHRPASKPELTKGKGLAVKESQGSLVIVGGKVAPQSGGGAR